MAKLSNSTAKHDDFARIPRCTKHLATPHSKCRVCNISFFDSVTQGLVLEKRGILGGAATRGILFGGTLGGPGYFPFHSQEPPLANPAGAKKGIAPPGAKKEKKTRAALKGWKKYAGGARAQKEPSV